MTTIYVNKDKELPERKTHDLYETERNLIVAAYDYEIPDKRSLKVLDIGAGDGRWGEEVKWINKDVYLVGVEIDPNRERPLGFNEWYNCDFLTWETDEKFDLIVANPPYYKAEEIIRKAWNMLANDGSMIMLLRLAFQAGSDDRGVVKGRYQSLWNEIYPYQVKICSRRPSFYDGGTNGTDYGVYYWSKDAEGKCIGIPRQWTVKLMNYDR